MMRIVGSSLLFVGNILTLDNMIASRDFCFIANLETFVWSSCNTIGLPDNGITYRAEHSGTLSTHGTSLSMII